MSRDEFIEKFNALGIGAPLTGLFQDLPSEGEEHLLYKLRFVTEEGVTESSMIGITPDGTEEQALQDAYDFFAATTAVND